MPSFFVLLAILLSSPTSFASSFLIGSESYVNSTTETPPVLTKRGNSKSLRILPVGDSITVGQGSTDGNGYRLNLENVLKSVGCTVDFIGSHTQGDNNPDNQHEGIGGQKIDDILNSITGDQILREQPNLVLLHAGTNDMTWVDVNDVESYQQAPSRLGNLIDHILCACPDAVVLVAKIIQNSYHPTQTDAFNAQVPAIVGERYKKGFKVRTVAQSGIGGDQMSDQLHPNDDGYISMAENWMAAIQNIPDGWLTDPIDAASSVSVEICARDKTYFMPWLNGNKIATGAHVNNDPGEPLSGPSNTFSPGWGDATWIAIGVGLDGLPVRFADLDGDGRVDYLYVDSDSGSVRAWLNRGGATWEAVNDGKEIAFGSRGNGGQVSFADLNGDKQDDYIVFRPDGSLLVYQNEGPDGTIWQWITIDVPSPVDYAPPLQNVLFGDMNGDGRADLGIIRDSGSIDFYISQGDVGTSSFSWKSCINKGISSGNRIILKDIDGDGRADYHSIDNEHGGVTGFLNKANGGDCDFVWVKVGGTDGIAIGASNEGAELVHLADYDGDGKADYLLVNVSTGAVQFWKNTGSSHPGESTALGGYGAGVRLADLDGDGRDDYISVGPNGEAVAYSNGGLNENGDGWIWNSLVTSGQIAAGVGAQRYQIHFADMNGDGLTDYLEVADDNGQVSCWLNGGPSSGGGWTWTAKGVIGIGVGRDGGIGVRFADMNSDGKADYIYLDENGAATVWLQTGTGDDLTGWEVQNNGAASAIGVGAYRGDVRFADIDGDGLADYLWVHPDDGATELWYNGSPSGSVWIYAGQIADGVGTRGQNIQFARIGTSGRVDFVAIEETTGALRAWMNGCSQVTGTRSSAGTGTSAGAGGCGEAPLATKIDTEPDPPEYSVSAIDLVGFDGCSEEQEQEIKKAWSAMVEMAKVMYNKIDFQYAIARHFLGPYDSLTEKDKQILKAVYTKATGWKLGGWLDLQITMHCDDFLRPKSPKCPEGTPVEEEYKCGSRCWRPRYKKDGTLLDFKPRAAAYTKTAEKGTIGAYLGDMNWCPSFFTLGRCQANLDKWKESKTGQRYNLNNYLCEESTIFHEITHLHFFGTQTQENRGTYDRKFRIKNKDTGIYETYQAYGPEYTKILARWAEKDVGYYTRTNADNLAMFFLVAWIWETTDLYPDEPKTDAVPDEIAGYIVDPFTTSGSDVLFEDMNDVATVLGVPVDEVATHYAYDDTVLDCFNVPAGADSSTPCDDSDNVPVGLDGSKSPIETVAADDADAY